MKILFGFLSVLLTAAMIIACRSEQKTNPSHEFGIYQVFTVDELPQDIKETLADMNGVSISDEAGPFTGYIEESAMPLPLIEISELNARLVKTHNAVDGEGGHFGLLAIGNKAGVEGSDIYKAVPQDYNIEIRFTRTGAEKWAEMTSQNVGRFVSFVIDGEVYSTPAVMAEIRMGKALITGIENEETAKELADLLNLK